MNEHEITGRMDKIQTICEQIAQGCGLAKQQGRMPTMAEARQMDELSCALLQEIRGLPQDACGKIGNPEQRHRAEAVLSSVRKALESVVRPDRPVRSRTNPVPRAALSRMGAYSTC